MKSFEIKHRLTGKVLFSLETGTLKLAVEAAVKSGADLRYANLRYANLSYANQRAADLRSADLRSADLSSADLRSADLRSADLRYANLRSADLRYAEIKFPKFPSISILSNSYLGTLPDELALELMRRDAASHPHPERFSEWAKGGGCPYKNEYSFWRFEQKKSVWKKGKPQMNDVDLILAICRAKKWEIEGYLD